MRDGIQRPLSCLAATGVVVSLGYILLLALWNIWIVETPFRFGVGLTIGWVPYLVRVIPQLRPDPWAVGTAIVCLLAVTAGMHAFLKWLYAATSAEPRRWPWNWTFKLVGLVVLIFVAGIAFTGMVHQTSWLVRSPEPLLRSSRDGMPRMSSANNLKQIGISAFNHEDVWKQLPRSQFDATGRPMHSWQTALLPFLEQGNLYNQIDLKKPWTDPANASAMSTRLKVFMHPSFDYDPIKGFGVTHYAGNVHVVLSDTPLTSNSFPAGTSNTILAGEVSSDFRPWGDPLNARDPRLGDTGQPNGFGGPNGKPAQFVMLDGSVRTFDPKTLAELTEKPPQ
jgi:hypothetical protein